MVKDQLLNDFISKSKDKHGDKYDYSLVSYENSESPVEIICKEHGSFWQRPYRHYAEGRGCPACGKRKVAESRASSTSDFINKAILLHGETYDYSLVVYKRSDEKVKIICKKHGIFEKRPNNHLSGGGCSKCAIENSRTTVLEYIEKAQSVHGSKYDYSMVNYERTTEKITVICPAHGCFSISADGHLRGYGCQKCADEKSRQSRENDFLEKAKNIHGNKYNYELVYYIDSETKVKIKCGIHGEFEKAPCRHLMGEGCQKCSIEVMAANQRYSTEDFVRKATSAHGNKYDYSNVNYANSTTPVEIVCRKHGAFWQNPQHHMSGSGCSKCANEKYSTSLFVSDATSVHGDKYDYSKIDYTNSVNRVTVVCREHGDFEILPKRHLDGIGCPVCRSINRKSLKLSTTRSQDKSILWARILNRFNALYGDKYDYSKAEYIDMRTDIKITCETHGEFELSPAEHIKGYGCEKCNGRAFGSYFEECVARALEKNSIKYRRQKSFWNCKHKNHLKFDFYLPDYKVVVEANGDQHKKPVSMFGGEEAFAVNRIRDGIKKAFVESVPWLNMIEINMWELKRYADIESVLMSKLDAIKRKVNKTPLPQMCLFIDEFDRV